MNNDAFNFATAAGGNGTFISHTSGATLKGDADGHDGNYGVLDIGSQGLEVLSTNASNDGDAFVFDSDESPSVEYDIADHDTEGIVLEEASDFFVEYGNLSYDTFGAIDVGGVDGQMWFLSVYNCTDGIEVVEDTNSWFYDDLTNDTPLGLLGELDAGTLFEEMLISGASTVGVEFESTTDVVLAYSTVSYSAIGFELRRRGLHLHLQQQLRPRHRRLRYRRRRPLGVVVYWNNFVDGSAGSSMPSRYPPRRSPSTKATLPEGTTGATGPAPTR